MCSNDPEGCDSDGEDSPDDEEDSNSTRTHRPSGTGRSSAGGDPTGSLSAGTGPSGSSLGPSDGSADSGSSRLSGGAIAGIVFGICKTLRDSLHCVSLLIHRSSCFYSSSWCHIPALVAEATTVGSQEQFPR